jgi:hypothetical protein
MRACTISVNLTIGVDDGIFYIRLPIRCRKKEQYIIPSFDIDLL